MGSGRTELVRALFGLAPVASGAVRIAARDRRRPAEIAVARASAQRVGYLSEDRKGEGLALPMSVADNLTMTGFSRRARRRVAEPVAASARRRGDWIAQRSGIKAAGPDQAVRTLSGGNQQKVALGRLLHQDADVLLLDEPTRGIDIGSKAQIYDAIAAGRRQRQGGADGQLLPARAVRPVRPAGGDESRPPVAARPIAEWTPESRAARGDRCAVTGSGCRVQRGACVTGRASALHEYVGRGLQPRRASVTNETDVHRSHAGSHGWGRSSAWSP